MAKVNTHGLKMVGLKKASGNTEDYGYYSPSYEEVFYDMKTGEVWTVFQHSLGQNWWTQYDDKNIIKICNTSHHMTMQEIADRIYDAVTKHHQHLEWLRNMTTIYGVQVRLTPQYVD